MSQHDKSGGGSDISSLWDKLDDAKEKLSQLKDSPKSSSTASKRQKSSTALKSSKPKIKNNSKDPSPKYISTRDNHSCDKYSKNDDHHRGVFQSDRYQDKYNSSPNSSINEMIVQTQNINQQINQQINYQNHQTNHRPNQHIQTHRIQGVAMSPENAMASENGFKYAPDQILVSKIQQTNCPISSNISSNEHQLEKLKKRIEAQRRYKQQQNNQTNSSSEISSAKYAHEEPFRTQSHPELTDLTQQNLKINVIRSMKSNRKMAILKSNPVLVDDRHKNEHTLRNNRQVNHRNREYVEKSVEKVEVVEKPVKSLKSSWPSSQERNEPTRKTGKLITVPDMIPKRVAQPIVLHGSHHSEEEMLAAKLEAQRALATHNEVNFSNLPENIQDLQKELLNLDKNSPANPVSRTRLPLPSAGIMPTPSAGIIDSTTDILPQTTSSLKYDKELVQSYMKKQKAKRFQSKRQEQTDKDKIHQAKRERLQKLSKKQRSLVAKSVKAGKTKQTSEPVPNKDNEAGDHHHQHQNFDNQPKSELYDIEMQDIEFAVKNVPIQTERAKQLMSQFYGSTSISNATKEDLNLSFESLRSRKSKNHSILAVNTGAPGPRTVNINASYKSENTPEIDEYVKNHRQSPPDYHAQVLDGQEFGQDSQNPEYDRNTNFNNNEGYDQHFSESLQDAHNFQHNANNLAHHQDLPNSVLLTEEGYSPLQTMQLIIPSQQMQEAMQQLDELNENSENQVVDENGENQIFLPNEQQERIQNYINQLGNKLGNLTNGDNLEEQQNLELQRIQKLKTKNSAAEKVYEQEAGLNKFGDADFDADSQFLSPEYPPENYDFYPENYDYKKATGNHGEGGPSASVGQQQFELESNQFNKINQELRERTRASKTRMEKQKAPWSVKNGDPNSVVNILARKLQAKSKSSKKINTVKKKSDNSDTNKLDSAKNKKLIQHNASKNSEMKKVESLNKTVSQSGSEFKPSSSKLPESHFQPKIQRPNTVDLSRPAQNKVQSNGLNTPYTQSSSDAITSTAVSTLTSIDATTTIASSAVNTTTNNTLTRLSPRTLQLKFCSAVQQNDANEAAVQQLQELRFIDGLACAQRETAAVASQQIEKSRRIQSINEASYASQVHAMNRPPLISPRFKAAKLAAHQAKEQLHLQMEEQTRKQLIAQQEEQMRIEDEQLRNTGGIGVPNRHFSKSIPKSISHPNNHRTPGQNQIRPTQPSPNYVQTNQPNPSPGNEQPALIHNHSHHHYPHQNNNTVLSDSTTQEQDDARKNLIPSEKVRRELEQVQSTKLNLSEAEYQNQEILENIDFLRDEFHNQHGKFVETLNRTVSHDLHQVSEKHVQNLSQKPVYRTYKRNHASGPRSNHNSSANFINNLNEIQSSSFLFGGKTAYRDAIRDVVQDYVEHQDIRAQTQLMRLKAKEKALKVQYEIRRQELEEQKRVLANTNPSPFMNAPLVNKKLRALKMRSEKEFNMIKRQKSEAKAAYKERRNMLGFFDCEDQQMKSDHGVNLNQTGLNHSLRNDMIGQSDSSSSPFSVKIRSKILNNSGAQNSGAAFQLSSESEPQFTEDMNNVKIIKFGQRSLSNDEKAFSKRQRALNEMNSSHNSSFQNLDSQTDKLEMLEKEDKMVEADRSEKVGNEKTSVISEKSVNSRVSGNSGRSLRENSQDQMHTVQTSPMESFRITTNLPDKVTHHRQIQSDIQKQIERDEKLIKSLENDDSLDSDSTTAELTSNVLDSNIVDSNIATSNALISNSVVKNNDKSTSNSITSSPSESPSNSLLSSQNESPPAGSLVSKFTSSKTPELNSVLPILKSDKLQTPVHDFSENSDVVTETARISEVSSKDGIENMDLKISEHNSDITLELTEPTSGQIKSERFSEFLSETVPVLEQSFDKTTEINTTGRIETIDVMLHEDDEVDQINKDSDLEENVDKSYDDDFSQAPEPVNSPEQTNEPSLSSSSSVKIISLNDTTQTPSGKSDDNTPSLSSVHFENISISAQDKSITEKTVEIQSVILEESEKSETSLKNRWGNDFEESELIDSEVVKSEHVESENIKSELIRSDFFDSEQNESEHKTEPVIVPKLQNLDNSDILDSSNSDIINVISTETTQNSENVEAFHKNPIKTITSKPVAIVGPKDHNVTLVEEEKSIEKELFSKVELKTAVADPEPDTSPRTKISEALGDILSDDEDTAQLPQKPNQSSEFNQNAQGFENTSRIHTAQNRPPKPVPAILTDKHMIESLILTAAEVFHEKGRVDSLWDQSVRSTHEFWTLGKGSIPAEDKNIHLLLKQLPIMTDKNNNSKAEESPIRTYLEKNPDSTEPGSTENPIPEQKSPQNLTDEQTNQIKENFVREEIELRKEADEGFRECLLQAVEHHLLKIQNWSVHMRPVGKENINAVLLKTMNSGVSLLGFQPIMSRNMRKKWPYQATKMQDRIEMILISELRKEEKLWSDYTRETELMKRKISDSVLDILIDEVIDDLECIEKKRANKPYRVPKF